ncbi:hypothetical protein ABEB36_011959 [Hypothenemus hampei]|uniref:C2H2-type domain-containing protein n=1 Tax=Hypothenemus hampei TaxID=57062 RepID=A0ABD1EAA9_HYPHA
MSSKDNMNNLKNITENEKLVIPLEIFDPSTQSLVKSSTVELKNSFFPKQRDKSGVPLNIVYNVVYPTDLNLKHVGSSQIIKKQKGRPKKSKSSSTHSIDRETNVPKKISQVVSKTRSGREVKFPKHIQNDFKKIITEDNGSDLNDLSDIKISDFANYTETKKDVGAIQENKLLELNSVQKKRRIAAQYRCPKCKKAYLGRNKILEHLKKNPTHGPMQESEKNHFEVWNYLVSITQKCPSSERGSKFCQELSNLLHNLVLLTNALFKRLGSASNQVEIDKVLGNAIGLNPGTYYFDDNNLYKDVTVLKLMGNSDFLNSIRSKNEEQQEKNSGCICKSGRIDEVTLKSMKISSEANDSIAKQIDGIQIKPMSMGSNSNITTQEDFYMSNLSTFNEFKEPRDILQENETSQSTETLIFEDFKLSMTTKTPKIKIHSNIQICPPKSKLKMEKDPLISTEFLIDNNTILQDEHCVDELMLPVSSNILDNSSSSNDAIHVGQFATENLFRKMTDLEVPNGKSLNIDDLSDTLDLFPFHGS